MEKKMLIQHIKVIKEVQDLFLLPFMLCMNKVIKDF
jgi:hypothetical protein